MRWLWLVVAATVATAHAQEPYQWPLDLPRALTSSFAEYRSGRFHAGIDLRTGDIGKDVRASADGYVSRLRCSPYGYGKAVYLQLDDGNSIVYGHLDSFEEPFASYVRAAQHREKDYTVDLTIPASQFRVRRGDIIAKSGQTGIGAPHLHYEIRDRAGQPINPRLLGITWPDTTQPVIESLLVVPLSPETRINGDIIPPTVKVTRDPDGVYRSKEIRANGAIAIGVDVVDPANAGESKLGVHILRTTVDGAERFRVQHDDLSYDNMNNGAVSYHPYFLKEGPYLMQWRWPGNRCSSYAHSTESGALTVSEATQRIRIEAIDFLDNQATVEVPIAPDHASPTEPAATATTGKGKVELDCYGNMLVVSATFSAPESEVPAFIMRGADAQPFFRVNDRIFRAVYAPSSSAREIAISVSHPRISANEHVLHVIQRGAASRIQQQGVTVEAGANAAYGVLFVQCSTAGAHKGTDGLVPVGESYSLWPDNMPIDDEVKVSIPIPDEALSDDQVGLYRKSGSGWARESAKRDGGRFVISTRRFGTYQAMRDKTAPSVEVQSPEAGKAITSKRPALVVRATDAGSGIARITAHCGAQWLLMEYDPERHRITWAKDEDLPTGDQTIQLVIVDGAGNATTTPVTVKIP